MSTRPEAPQHHIARSRIVYRWVAPALMVILFIVVPDFIQRSLLFGSYFWDWFFRLLITSSFCFQYWHFAKPPSYDEFWGDVLETGSLGGERTAKILYLAGIFGQTLLAVFFTQWGIQTFVPVLGNWGYVITAINGLVHFYNMFVRFRTYTWRSLNHSSR